MSLHRSPLTIRASLALLVIACVVPGALSSVYFIADNYRLEKEHRSKRHWQRQSSGRSHGQGPRQY